jgi:3-deoxy-D-manno-octulosonic-acid transferase
MAAYRGLARRSSKRGYEPGHPRPAGTLLWIHAAEQNSLLAVQDLAQRLCTSRYRLSVLITVSDANTMAKAQRNWPDPSAVFLDMVPSEHPDAIAAFWRHWRPDMAIWTWGALRPNLIEHTHENRCTIALVNADADGFDSRLDRWIPDLSRQLLDPFVALMARSSEGLTRLEQLGLPRARIDQTPPLQAGGSPLACNERDLKELSEILGGRSVWLACCVQEDELDIILKAHRNAHRMAHRLLLILHPASPDMIGRFADRILEEEIRLANWDDGDVPTEATQVLLAAENQPLGMFYRVSPVSLMGSSLVPGFTGRNPYEAAALGSAVLYGPHVNHFLPFYTRLAKAGAARIVNDADTLRAAVTRLIAPDQAATMAHAGWDVISEGAYLTDRVIDLVQTVLDGDLEGWHART